MSLKPGRSKPARLFAAKQSKDNGASRFRPESQRSRQLQYGSRAGGVIVRTVVNGVAFHSGTDSQVIEMRAQQDNPRSSIHARNLSHGIPGKRFFRFA